MSEKSNNFFSKYYVYILGGIAATTVSYLGYLALSRKDTEKKPETKEEPKIHEEKDYKIEKFGLNFKFSSKYVLTHSETTLGLHEFLITENGENVGKIAFTFKKETIEETYRDHVQVSSKKSISFLNEKKDKIEQFSYITAVVNEDTKRVTYIISDLGDFVCSGTFIDELLEVVKSSLKSITFTNVEAKQKISFYGDRFSFEVPLSKMSKYQITGATQTSSSPKTSLINFTKSKDNGKIQVGDKEFYQFKVESDNKELEKLILGSLKKVDSKDEFCLVSNDVVELKFKPLKFKHNIFVPDAHVIYRANVLGEDVKFEFCSQKKDFENSEQILSYIKSEAEEDSEGVEYIIQDKDTIAKLPSANVAFTYLLESSDEKLVLQTTSSFYTKGNFYYLNAGCKVPKSNSKSQNSKLSHEILSNFSFKLK